MTPHGTARGPAPLGIAVVGCGRWGANHVRVAADTAGVRLVGVVDADPEQRHQAGQSHGVPAWSTLEQALEDRRVEAVIVATPAGTHAELVRRALLAGRHVLVEKPAAMSVADASEMVRIAAGAGRQLSAGHTFLYAQPVRNIASWLRDVGPSRPWLARSERLGGRRRADCSVLWNFGPHDVSLLLHLLGEPVVEVAARGHRFPGSGRLDTVTVDLGFASGARGEIYLGWRHPGAKRSLRLLGEDWALRYRHGHLDGQDVLTLTGRPEDAVLGSGCLRDERNALGGYVEPLHRQLEEFASACRTGTPTVTGPEHLLAITSVLEAAEYSAALGGLPYRIASAAVSSEDRPSFTAFATTWPRT
ncbi:putative dehydrogenase [Streptacidiphilus sp. MAP12-16]|uniref:Gfo/Idh/MocA family protein n=1 Tax=Streptacidiphilus sp. MAP12-16 TaxID=3156300 RepID=UPI0035132216